MVTKEVDEEMDNCYEDMMDEVLEESMVKGLTTWTRRLPQIWEMAGQP